MSDTVEYALNSGLECMIMPDGSDTSALFARNRNTNDISSVCKIIQTDFEKNSSEYIFLLEQIKKEIDSFIKNNPEFIEENKNDKN
jgi:hypothetical protein